MTSRCILYESITNAFPHASLASFDIRSKYTSNDRNTSLLAGQYFRIRSKYASRVMVGMFRAWKVRDMLLDRAERDAVVNVRHIGGKCASEAGELGVLTA